MGDPSSSNIFTRRSRLNAEKTWVEDKVHSPCIDASDPKDDWSNEPQPHGWRVNMGAYGNTREASKSLKE